ncbi:tyrosine-type recombinase/integrase [Thiorhodovibrio litoralis]|uniref:tyrosine-type recombinase/integrase n=1 Tax=Thiorhodovibrio litoralis TaxID=2952932 RepID=UPI002B25AE92|nr:integrase arm-type DNA-binding domain-containing protein [Thiorhodovibrio litoralis]WPL11360.1 Prophage CP4-57 integrase [Thiorhodovibrio litoralis]WPL14024.1 Prophage CP4-57 integrase [Thiorhodovibrio litoralis]
MAAIHKLTDRQAQTARKTISDGGNLYLVVGKNGSKKWVFRYSYSGKSRAKGLGSYPSTTLADARDQAAKARDQLKAGVDPLDAPVDDADAEPSVPSFTQVAARFIRGRKRSWSNPKHRRQWVSTMRTYARPVIGSKPVDSITTADVLAILEPIWHSRTETAKRVQGRVENILDFASAHGWRDPLNPARWRGHLDKLLPAAAKVKRQKTGGVTRHHPALDHRDLPRFYAELVATEGLSALALRWLILTATRTSETLKATWSEIDLESGVWSIPGERMKTRVDHRVPLTDEMRAILDQLPRVDGEDWLFPGERKGKPLSNMALLMQMRRMGYGVKGTRGDAVPHGMRATFKTWSGEVSTAPREIVEAALAHALESKVEQAYQRGDLLAKRRRLMEQWSDWCTRPSADVVDLAERRKAG